MWTDVQAGGRQTGGQTAMAMAERKLRNRPTAFTEAASEGWDMVSGATRSPSPSFAALLEAVGLYLAAHKGRLWQLTEAEQRELIRRAHDIDAERRDRRH